MPNFEVTSPDGRKFVVTAPEGASQDEVLRYAQQNMPAPQSPPAEPISRARRFMQGMGDLPKGYAQFVANVVPDAMKPFLNAATRYGVPLPFTALPSRLLGPIQGQSEANAAATAREAEYQNRLKASGVDGIDWPRIAGQAVTSLPAMAIPGANTYLGAAGLGAAAGAVQSGLSPVPGAADGADYAEGAAKNAALGGVAGAAGGAVGKALGGLIAPRIDQNVRTLADAGVELTPGQIMGGTARKVEDAAVSIPVIGTGVANAQNRSLASFNRAVGNEVLAPIGQTVPKDTAAGRALINQVDEAIGKAYQAAHAKVKPFVPDVQFGQDFQELMRNNILMPDQRDFFNAFMSRQLLPRMQKGPIDGQELQNITSALKSYARSYGSSSEVADREMAKVFRGMVDIFDDLTARTNPAAAPEIAKANAAFARMIRMEGAAASVGATEGVFTAPQFSRAVRQANMSPRKREFGHGNALMQNLSDPAKAVLPSTVPDSGTPLRSMVGLLGASAVSGSIDPALMASYLAATGAGRMAYSEPATRAFRATMLARRPGWMGMLGEGVRRAGQASGPAVGGMLLEGLR